MGDISVKCEFEVNDGDLDWVKKEIESGIKGMWWMDMDGSKGWSLKGVNNVI